jgi:hypothetical protein
MVGDGEMITVIDGLDLKGTGFSPCIKGSKSSGL